MILRKYMAILGIGSAQIDLILEKDTYKPGEQVKGYFLVKGGLIEQQLKRIECDLVMFDEGNHIKNELVVDSMTILTTMHIESDTSNQITFSFHIPQSINTSCSVSYRFKTRLVFKQGMESHDHDVISIVGEQIRNELEE